MAEIDAAFLSYPARELAGVALERATELGAEHADFRLERIRTGAEWAADNPQTWYSPGPAGYTDYPALVAA